MNGTRRFKMVDVKRKNNESKSVISEQEKAALKLSDKYKRLGKLAQALNKNK